MSDGAYLRYVALGDSQTEGVGDGDDATALRGWADRLAETVARSSPGLRYANLAVRGRLAGQVRAEQLAPALALRPDLATVVAGVNDLLRPRVDVDAVAGHLESMFAALGAQGARVATLTFPDPARIAPLARPVSHRVVALNDRIKEAARRHDVVVVDASHHPVVTDPRMWSADRLHASPRGTRSSPPPSRTRSACPAVTTAGRAPCSPLRQRARDGAPSVRKRAGPAPSWGHGSCAGCAAGPPVTDGRPSDPTCSRWPRPPREFADFLLTTGVAS